MDLANPASRFAVDRDRGGAPRMEERLLCALRTPANAEALEQRADGTFGGEEVGLRGRLVAPSGRPRRPCEQRRDSLRLARKAIAAGKVGLAQLEHANRARSPVAVAGGDGEQRAQEP